MTVPEGWDSRPIGSVAELYNGRGFKPTEWARQGTPIVRIQNLNGSAEYNYYDGGVAPRNVVDAGDLLFAWSGSRGTSFGPFIWRGPRSAVNQHIFKVESARDVLRSYLYYALLDVTASVERRAHGSAGLVHITKAELGKMRILLPPLPEQRAIAEILGTWDEAIALTERRLEAARQRKRGLMQQLLLPDDTGVPRLRLAGYPGEWGSARMGEVFERVTRRNGEGNENVLSISGQLGLIGQRSYFGRSVAGEDLSGYWLLREGEFAYNRSSSAGYPMGAIKRLSGCPAGVVSTLYICFRISDEHADPDFYVHFFEAGGLDRGIYNVATEGARCHGLLNVGLSDFFAIRVPKPPLEEQRALARVLSAADSEVELTARKLFAMQQQKKGLMQRLLTGVVRAPTGEEARGVPC